MVILDGELYALLCSGSLAPVDPGDLEVLVVVLAHADGVPVDLGIPYLHRFADRIPGAAHRRPAVLLGVVYVVVAVLVVTVSLAQGGRRQGLGGLFDVPGELAAAHVDGGVEFHTISRRALIATACNFPR